MKYVFLLIFLFVIGCTESSKTASHTPPRSLKKTSVRNTVVDPVSPWFQFYLNENPSFDNSKFYLKNISVLPSAPTSISILSDKKFDEIYKPFLVFNSDSSRYLDFDSYHWFADEDRVAGFEADQQLVLVDLKKDRARQLMFTGPSFLIEDVYWKGDSAAVVLGNSSDRIPFASVFNFNKNQQRNYGYPDTLRYKKSYYEKRLNDKGIKTD